MACIVMACVVMAYIVMAYIVKAYVIMAYIVKAYVVMANIATGVCSGVLAMTNAALASRDVSRPSAVKPGLQRSMAYIVMACLGLAGCQQAQRREAVDLPR